MKIPTYFVATALFVVCMTAATTALPLAEVCKTAATTALPLAELQPEDNDLDVNIPNHTVAKRQNILPDSCLDKLYILAFTSGVTGAASDKGHEVELRAGGATRHVVLPNLPGDDYMEHKGDLWKINLSRFSFPSNCIKIGDIETIAITEHSIDSWNIDSIVTFLVDTNDAGNTYQLATQDLDVFRWIDGDGSITQKRFELTLVI